MFIIPYSPLGVGMKTVLNCLGLVKRLEKLRSKELERLEKKRLENLWLFSVSTNKHTTTTRIAKLALTFSDFILRVILHNVRNYAMTNDDTRLACRWGVGRVVIGIGSIGSDKLFHLPRTGKNPSIIFDASRQTVDCPFVYKGFSFDYGF